MGRKFVKQHSIKNYIVDFYCASEKHIVEFDGEVHKNPSAKAYDQTRTKVLENLESKIIRFENKMVFENLPSVLLGIQENFDAT